MLNSKTLVLNKITITTEKIIFNGEFIKSMVCCIKYFISFVYSKIHNLYVILKLLKTMESFKSEIYV